MDRIMRRYSPDDFLTLKQLARVLKLDPRTVKRVAFQLGGRRMGQCWRFNWGAVLEFFHADIETRQGRPLAGPRGAGRKTDRLQNVPSRKKIRAAMAGRKKMGRGTACKGDSGTGDPHGLGTAYGLGE